MQFFSQDLIWATWDPRHTTNPKSENLLCSSHLLEPFFSSCLQSHWFPGALVSPSILVLSKCPHTRSYCTEPCPAWSNHCQSNRARFCHPYSLCTTSNPIKRVSWCEELRRYFWTSSRSVGELWLTRWRSLLWKETLLCQHCSPWKLRPQAVHGSYSCSKAWLWLTKILCSGKSHRDVWASPQPGCTGSPMPTTAGHRRLSRSLWQAHQSRLYEEMHKPRTLQKDLDPSQTNLHTPGLHWTGVYRALLIISGSALVTEQ